MNSIRAKAAAGAKLTEAESRRLVDELLTYAKDHKKSLGNDWQEVAEECYGFSYACQHADIDPTCQEFLSDEAQANLLVGKLPERGKVRMCSNCWKMLDSAPRVSLKATVTVPIDADCPL